MCHKQYSVDRYPDNREILQKVEWINCDHGPISRPWDCRYEDEDETLIYNIGRLNLGGNASDTSSRRASSVGDCTRSTRTRPRSSRREERPFTPLVFNAIFGERTSSHRSRRSESRTIVIETNPSRAPQIYLAPVPSPTYRSSYESTTRYSESPMSPRSPMTPGYAGSFEADIVDASPYTRGRPIIHNESRRSRRNESTEVHSGPSRARSPSPNIPDVRNVRAREERRAQEENRRRRRAERDARISELERDAEKERRRQERRRKQELENPEINARLPRASPVVRQGILRQPSTRAGRDGVIDDLRMSERGEQVIRQAIRDRERADEEARLEEEMHQAEVERRRLARRFHRSERIVYRDDDYRR